MDLRNHIQAFQEGQGVTRLIVMAQIRDYMARIGTEEALKEISTLTTDKQLNILVGVGLKGVLYHKVLAHKARLEGLI